MNDHGGAGLRQVGVTIPASQRLEQGSEVNVLLNCMPLEQFAIRYADDQGRIHTTIAIRCGKKWYLPPNGETWTGSLRPLNDDWLEKLLEPAAQRLKAATTPVASNTVPVPDVNAVVPAQPPAKK
jgi:hypothetical protein